MAQRERRQVARFHLCVDAAVGGGNCKTAIVERLCVNNYCRCVYAAMRDTPCGKMRTVERAHLPPASVDLLMQF